MRIMNNLFLVMMVGGMFCLSLFAEEPAAKPNGAPPVAPAGNAGKQAEAAGVATVKEDGTMGLHTPAALIKAVEARNTELGRREAQVSIREEQLQEMEKEVSAMLERNALLLKEIEERQKQLDQAQEEKLVTLAKTYAAMPPEEAAIRIEQMEESLALNILARSKPKIAAKFLSGMSPAKATKLTQKFARPAR